MLYSRLTDFLLAESEDLRETIFCMVAYMPSTILVVMWYNILIIHSDLAVFF